ncbi:hypothetical protein BDV93DRAFT_121721 [Ceratobasidium sp. AG-I]|nr:hypothetical protein BDV93DRAFT_121721 [Ceratobasidium sp. AG-I]
MGRRISIKCVFLHFPYRGPLQWSGVDRLLSHLPSTVENLLCFYEHTRDGYSASAIQRGLHGQVKRKEYWHSPHTLPSTFDWVMLQTSHIIPYRSINLSYFKSHPVNLLCTETYVNCTKRQGGLPSKDAIPTGGQLVRIAHVKCVDWRLHWHPVVNHLVWSSQSFAEGEHVDVCSTPLFGPKCL